MVRFSLESVVTSHSSAGTD